MTPVTTAKITYGTWGLLCGGLLTMTLGFAWGGWSTTSTTKRVGDEAVLAARAAICVAQFLKEPYHHEHLQAFREFTPTNAVSSSNTGAGRKCLGRNRPAIQLPTPAPMGWKC